MTAPLEISQCVLFLDPVDITTMSDYTAIRAWSDKSDTEAIFSQTTEDHQPDAATEIFRGQRLVTFDGDDFLDSGVESFGATGLFADSSEAFSVFSVMRFSGSNTGYGLSKAGGSSSLRTFGFFRNTSPQNVTGICRGSQKNIVENYVDDTIIVLGAIWTGSALTYYALREGDTEWTEVIGNVGTADEESTNILLGARSSGTGYFLTGDLGPQIIYDKALNSTELSGLFDYFYAYLNTATYDARFLIFGASIMADSFGKTVPAKILDAEAKFYIAYQKSIDLIPEAVSGYTTTSLRENIDTILATYAVESYPTYCPIHIGGNNVSNNRPYATDSAENIATMESDITYIVQAIITKGFTPILGDISFRNYDGNTVCNPENGSLPYNTNVIRPLQQSLTPDYVRTDGTPFWQMYDLVLNDYVDFLDDGVHLNLTGQEAVRQHLVDGVGCYIFDASIPDSIAQTELSVSAGEAQSVTVADSVTLTGICTEECIISYLWEQISGTPVVITNPDTLSATFIAPDLPGAATFQLTVENAHGVIGIDTVITTFIADAVTGLVTGSFTVKTPDNGAPTERGVMVVTFAPVDGEGNAIPLGALQNPQWRLTDCSGNTINGNDFESNDMIDFTWVLSGDDLKIIAGNNSSKRYIGVQAQYDSDQGDGLWFTGEMVFTIKKLVTQDDAVS